MGETQSHLSLFPLKNESYPFFSPLEKPEFPPPFFGGGSPPREISLNHLDLERLSFFAAGRPSCQAKLNSSLLRRLGMGAFHAGVEAAGPEIRTVAVGNRGMAGAWSPKPLVKLFVFFGPHQDLQQFVSHILTPT